MIESYNEIITSKEFIIAFIGALIGGSFVLLGVILSEIIKCCIHRRNNKKILNALNAQANSLWDMIYDLSSFLKKLKYDEPLFYMTDINQDYFSIFDNHSHLIGSIGDVEYRTALVDTYLHLKRFADILVSHTSDVKTWLDLRSNFELTTSKQLEGNRFFGENSIQRRKKLIVNGQAISRYIDIIQKNLDTYNELHKNRECIIFNIKRYFGKKVRVNPVNHA